MILKERVPFQVSRFAMFAVVVLGLLTLPGWTQSPARNTETENTFPDDEKPATSARAKTAPSIEPFDDSPTSNSDRSTIGSNSGTAESTSNIAAQEEKGEVSNSPLETDPAGTPNSVRPRNRVDQIEPIQATPTKGSTKRVQVLEQQLRQLQQEINNLRNLDPFTNSAGNNSFAQTQRPANKEREPDTSDSGNDKFGGSTSQQPGQDGRIVATRTITLQRTTYRLPVERSKSLETFLGQHVKAEVLTISITSAPKIDDLYQGPGAAPARQFDPTSTKQEATITITTTPEVQRVIGGLILIMRKDAPEKLLPAIAPTLGLFAPDSAEVDDTTTIRRRRSSQGEVPVEIRPPELPEPDPVRENRNSFRFGVGSSPPK